MPALTLGWLSRRLAAGCCCLSLLLTAGAQATAADTRLKAGVFSPAHAAPEFSLRGSDGNELTLGRYRGKVVMLFFGFTHCAEVCPVTLATLTAAHKALGPAAGDVQVLYVTVDPERDSAERLAQYLKAFDASFIGGTGRPDTLAGMRKRYGVAANKVVSKAAPGTYAVDHSSSVYLIDRGGRLRAMMPFGHSAADYVHDVRLLLQK